MNSSKIDREVLHTVQLLLRENACVLHYIDNNLECKDGDVVLMDFGAEYANYTRYDSDDSRKREVYTKTKGGL